MARTPCAAHSRFNVGPPFCNSPAGFASWLNLQLVRAAQGQAPAVPLLLQSEAQQLEAAAAVAGHVVAPLGHQQHLPAENPRQQQQQQQHPQLQVNHQQEQQQGQQQQRAAALLGRAVRGDAWLLSSCLEAAVQPVLLRLAAHYLLRERRRGLALDPVANFHLRNGAAVMQLNWRADVSKLGLQRSHGIMVSEVGAPSEVATTAGQPCVQGVPLTRVPVVVPCCAGWVLLVAWVPAGEPAVLDV